MEKEFYITLLKKTLVMIGFTYFSVAVATQAFTNILPSIIAGGAYCFTELCRFYRVNEHNKTLRARKKKIISIGFLI